MNRPSLQTSQPGGTTTLPHPGRVPGIRRAARWPELTPGSGPCGLAPPLEHPKAGPPGPSEPRSSACAPQGPHSRARAEPRRQRVPLEENATWEPGQPVQLCSSSRIPSLRVRPEGSWGPSSRKAAEEPRPQAQEEPLRPPPGGGGGGGANKREDEAPFNRAAGDPESPFLASPGRGARLGPGLWGWGGREISAQTGAPGAVSPGRVTSGRKAESRS